jgi:hypothetical protein
MRWRYTGISSGCAAKSGYRQVRVTKLLRIEVAETPVNEMVRRLIDH